MYEGYIDSGLDNVARFAEQITIIRANASLRGRFGVVLAADNLLKVLNS